MLHLCPQSTTIILDSAGWRLGLVHHHHSLHLQPNQSILLRGTESRTACVGTPSRDAKWLRGLTLKRVSDAFYEFLIIRPSFLQICNYDRALGL